MMKAMIYYKHQYLYFVLSLTPLAASVQYMQTFVPVSALFLLSMKNVHNIPLTCTIRYLKYKSISDKSLLVKRYL